MSDTKSRGGNSSNGNTRLDRRSMMMLGTTAMAAVAAVAANAVTQTAQAQAQQPASPQPPRGLPNVLAIFGDDVGWFDVGCYHRGMMGVKTPNIDRIAREGVMLN